MALAWETFTLDQWEDASISDWATLLLDPVIAASDFSIVRSQSFLPGSQQAQVGNFSLASQSATTSQAAQVALNITSQSEGSTSQI